MSILSRQERSAESGIALVISLVTLLNDPQELHVLS